MKGVIKKGIFSIFLLSGLLSFSQENQGEPKKKGSKSYKENQLDPCIEELKEHTYKCYGPDSIKSYLFSPWERHYGSFTFSEEGKLYYDQKGQFIDLSRKKKLTKVNHHVYFYTGTKEDDDYLSNIICSVDHVLYNIQAWGIYSSLTFKIKSQNELDSIIMGFSEDEDKEKRAAVTLNNTFYWIKGDKIIFSYHHNKKGKNWSNKEIKYRNYDPLIAKFDENNYKLISRFSNGDLVAFDHEGNKLWEMSLPTNAKDKEIHYLSFFDEYKKIIAINRSFVFAIEANKGKILWSFPIKSTKAILSSDYNVLRDEPVFYLTTLENELVKLSLENKRIIWKKPLPIKGKEIYYNFDIGRAMLLSTNVSKMFFIDDITGEIIKKVSIPEGVYHPRMIHPPGGDAWDAAFNTEHGGYGCSLF